MRERLAQVAHPGPLPRPVVVTGVALFAVTLALIAVLVWLGVLWHATPSKYFRERRIGTYYSGALLVTSAAVAAALARRDGPASSRRFWTVAALGFVYLTLDEVLTIHEEADRWAHAALGWDPKHWLTDHLDDAIVAVYGLVALGWTWWHRDALLRLRWTTILLMAAFGGFVIMEILDSTGFSATAEDSLKLLAEVVIVLALLAGYHDLAVRPPE
jgi:hypothetical protein